jgi:hypothetical protein
MADWRLQYLGVSFAGNGGSPNIQDKPTPCYWNTPRPDVDDAAPYGSGS